jgi:leader peptidase (prepilin peptidase)/N-methyltransferase
VTAVTLAARTLPTHVTGLASSGSRPAAAVATAGCCGLLALRMGADPALPAYLYLAVLGVTLARIDFEQQRLPDVLTLPAYPVTAGLLTAAALAGSRSGDLLRALLGGVAMLAVYVGIRVIHQPGMGLGDVKLAGALGIAAAWLGWDSWMLALLAPFLLGTAAGLLLLARRRAGLRTQLSFGPYMLTGALLAVLVT